MQNEEIIYSINVEDLQNVAVEELDRTLSEKELQIVEHQIGKYIPWYDIISEIINSDEFNNHSK